MGIITNKIKIQTYHPRTQAMISKSILLLIGSTAAVNVEATLGVTSAVPSDLSDATAFEASQISTEVEEQLCEKYESKIKAAAKDVERCQLDISMMASISALPKKINGFPVRHLEC